MTPRDGPSGADLGHPSRTFAPDSPAAGQLLSAGRDNPDPGGTAGGTGRIGPGTVTRWSKKARVCPSMRTPTRCPPRISAASTTCRPSKTWPLRLMVRSTSITPTGRWSRSVAGMGDLEPQSGVGDWRQAARRRCPKPAQLTYSRCTVRRHPHDDERPRYRCPERLTTTGCREAGTGYALPYVAV